MGWKYYGDRCYMETYSQGENDSSRKTEDINDSIECPFDLYYSFEVKPLRMFVCNFPNSTAPQQRGFWYLDCGKCHSACHQKYHQFNYFNE